MQRNRHKGQHSRSIFTYLEDRLRIQSFFPQGVPVHYLPRVLFLLMLGLFYVGNTHHHEKMVRKLAQLEQATAAQRVAYTTLKAEYMLECKQSKVAMRAAQLGLYESPNPPLKIKAK